MRKGGVGECHTEHKVRGSLLKGEIHFALEHQGVFLEDGGFDQKPKEWVGQCQASTRDGDGGGGAKSL